MPNPAEAAPQAQISALGSGPTAGTSGPTQQQSSPDRSSVGGPSLDLPDQRSVVPSAVTAQGALDASLKEFLSELIPLCGSVSHIFIRDSIHLQSNAIRTDTHNRGSFSRQNRGGGWSAMFLAGGSPPPPSPPLAKKRKKRQPASGRAARPQIRLRPSACALHGTQGPFLPLKH